MSRRSKRNKQKRQHKRVPGSTIEISKESRPSVGIRQTVIKVGSFCTDKATNLRGMVTKMHVELNRAIFYSFQPSGLNPEDGEPLKGMWVSQDRLEGGERIPMPDIPLNVLGTHAKDLATPFEGMITTMCLHISGCVHVGIQPSASHPKTGGPISAYDFDIRRVTGPAIPLMSEQQREADQQKKPSPIEDNGSPLPIICPRESRSLDCPYAQ